MNLFSWLMLAVILAKLFGMAPVAVWPWWVVLAPLGIPAIIFVMATVAIVFTDSRRRY